MYDIASSYLEGEKNELAEYGYNRARKKGKKRIVIGLLTGYDGEPLSVEVFRGNINDPNTVNIQIEKLINRFSIFMENGAKVSIEGNTVTVYLKKKIHLPILFELPWMKQTTKLAWMKLNIQYAAGTAS